MDIFVLFIALIALLGLMLLGLIAMLRRKRGLTEKDHQFILQKWNQISEMAKNQGNHAIIEADKLLDHVLSKKGFSGTLAEKLKSAEDMFQNADNVWDVHKLRNKIAHEVDFSAHAKHIDQSLDNLKKALKDLGAKL